jgi:hypothetical protein
MVGKMNQEMGLDSKFFYTNMYEIVTEIILCYRQYGTLFFAEKIHLHQRNPDKMECLPLISEQFWMNYILYSLHSFFIIFLSYI